MERASSGSFFFGFPSKVAYRYFLLFLRFDWNHTTSKSMERCAHTFTFPIARPHRARTATRRSRSAWEAFDCRCVGLCFLLLGMLEIWFEEVEVSLPEVDGTQSTATLNCPICSCNTLLPFTIDRFCFFLSHSICPLDYKALPYFFFLLRWELSWLVMWI